MEDRDDQGQGCAGFFPKATIVGVVLAVIAVVIAALTLYNDMQNNSVQEPSDERQLPTLTTAPPQSPVNDASPENARSNVVDEAPVYEAPTPASSKRAEPTYQVKTEGDCSPIIIGGEVEKLSQECGAGNE